MDGHCEVSLTIQNGFYEFKEMRPATRARAYSDTAMCGSGSDSLSKITSSNTTEAGSSCGSRSSSRSNSPSGVPAANAWAPQGFFLLPVLVQPAMMTQQLCARPVPQVQVLQSSTCGTSEKDTETCQTTVMTTVMLRNLPKTLGRNDFVELLKREGFQNRFDFVYVPADYKHHVSFGYAFVNFSTNEDAELAMRHFEGFRNWPVESDKQCNVMWSDKHQGLEAHIESFRNSPVMHPDVPQEYRPVIYDSRGEQIPFPSPTVSIRAPPARRRITARTRAALADA